MPTCDEEGPTLFHLRSAAEDRTIAFRAVLRDCAVAAHADWQEALAVSLAAQRAARAATGTAQATFLFDKSVAAHNAAKLAEGVYNRAREAWFQLDAAALTKFKRRFRFEDCMS